jgi:two-component system LytT family response regulator
MAEKLSLPKKKPPPLRVVLVDDEPAASAWLADLLSRYEHVEIIGRAIDADGAERLIKRLAPDVVFVDIEMTGRDGLAVIDRLDGKTRGVVVTAFDDYAVEAFDTATVDYLLKPVTAAGLSRTLARLACGSGRTAVAAEDDAATTTVAVGEASDSRIPLAAEGKTVLVTLAEILWIEAAENCSHVYRIAEPALFVRQSLGRWESMLPAEAFLRISRSVIIRLDRIEGIRWNWQQGTQLNFVGSDATLRIGRSAARRLKDRLEP